MRFRSAQTAHMGDVVVDKDEWLKLSSELYGIREDATAVNKFMARHANKKWEVCSASVGLFAEFALIRIIVKKNGAPVWLIRAANCEENVLQWLVDNGITSTAVDSFV